MAELADSVLLSRSGMTRLVDRLAKEELLERDLCTDDGRGCYAVLTEKGAELLATARPTHLDGVRERFLRHFSQDEMLMLASMWERVLPGRRHGSRLTRGTASPARGVSLVVDRRAFGATSHHWRRSRRCPCR